VQENRTHAKRQRPDLSAQAQPRFRSQQAEVKRCDALASIHAAWYAVIATEHDSSFPQVTSGLACAVETTQDGPGKVLCSRARFLSQPALARNTEPRN